MLFKVVEFVKVVKVSLHMHHFQVYSFFCLKSTFKHFEFNAFQLFELFETSYPEEKISQMFSLLATTSTKVHTEDLHISTLYLITGFFLFVSPYCVA